MFDKKQAASDYRQAILNGMAINQQTSEQIANIQNGYQNYQSMVALGASTLGKVSDVEEEQIAEAQEIARNSFMGNPNLETSQQRRRRDLQQRTSRIAERLSGVTAQRDSIHADDLKLKGLSDEEIQAAQTTQDRLRDTDQTSDLERAENAIKLYLGSDEEKQNAIYDRDIEYFVKNDAQITEMHFGKDSAMYKAIQAIKEYNNRNLNSETSVNTSDKSVLNFSNLVATSASGLSELVGGFSSIYHRTTKDGKEREEAINNEDSWANQLQRFSDKIATAGLNASKQRVSLIQSRAKEEGDRARELALKQGISKAQADKIARDVTSEINDGLYNVPMSISAEVAEFLPDLITTALTMGVTSVASASIKTGLNSVAKALGKGASKAEAKLAGEKAMKEFAKTELKAGRTITAEQAKQAQKEGTKAYFQAQRAQASKLDSKIVNAVGITEEAIETGSQNAVQGYQQASEAIKSMKIEDLKASKRGQEILKENPEISDEDLKLQLADEAGVLAYDMTFGGTAAMGILSGKVQTKAINAWKNLGSAKGDIGALGTSILQEFFGEGFEEGWTQFSSNFAESKLNQNKDLFEGVYDNAKYGAITGAASTSISNAPELIKLSAGETIKQVGKKIEGFQEKSLNKKSDKELETIYGSFSDDSVNGVTGKKFSETSFGKTYNSLKESSDEIITKNIDPESYTSTIKNLQKEGIKLIKEIQSSTDATVKEKLTQDFQQITTAISSFRDALDDDIVSSSKSLYKDVNQFKELIKNPEENAQKIQDLQIKIQKQMDDSSVIKQIEDSSLFKMLNNIEDTKDTSKVSIEQILGNPKFSAINSTEARTNAENTITKTDTKNTATFRDALKDYSINVAKSKNTTNADALKDTKQLFQTIKTHIESNPNVSKNFKNAFNVLSKNLDNYSDSEPKDLKAFRQLFFGGMEGDKYRYGLLDILSQMKDDGSISLQGIVNLNKLYSHQIGKQEALRKGYKELKTTGSHSPIINQLDISGSPREVLTDDRKQLDFNHEKGLKGLKTYGKLVSRDVEVFSQFADFINLSEPEKSNESTTLEENNFPKETKPFDVVNPKEEKEEVKEPVEPVEIEEPSNPLSSVKSVKDLNRHLSSLGSNENISDVEIKEKYQELTNSTDEDTDIWFNNELDKILEKEKNQNLIDKTIEAWKQFEPRWEKERGDKYKTITDSEDSNITLEDSKGNQVNIPVSALVYLRDLGFHPTKNLVDEITTSTGEELLSISEIIDTNDSTKEGKVFIKGLKELSQYIKDFYNKQSNDVFNPKKKSPFTLLNGFLNFVDGNGKPTETIQRALTLGLTNVIGNSHAMSFQKNDQYLDYFESRGAYDVIVEIRNNAEKYGDNYASKKDPIQLIEPTNITEENISAIGKTKPQFIYDLGKEVFAHTGLKWNTQSKEYADNVKDGIINALGQQAYLLLLNSDMINVYQVKLVGSGSTETLHYVNFKTNDGSLSQKHESIFNVVAKQSPLPNLSIEQAENKLEKTKLGLQANLVLGMNSKISEDLFSRENSKRAVTIGSLKSLKNADVRQDSEVSNKDIATELTSRKSKVLDNAVDVHNKTTFAVNMPLYNLLKNNEEAFKLAMGYVPNVDNLPLTTFSKKSIQSKNRQIQRSIDLFKNYINQASQLGIEPNDMMLHFKHYFVSNNRIMLESDINPQSDKIIRELLRLVQKNINNDGTVIGELNLDITLGKTFDNRSNKSKRSIQKLINVANSKKNSKNKNFSFGFLLALAQGLDITKIEKQLTPNIFKAVSEALSEDSIYMRMADLVWKINQANEAGEQYIITSEESKLLEEFASKLGNAAPRAFNAIESLANYLYRGTDSDRFKDNPRRTKWTTSLLLESDGISNGMYNIIRQFNTRFSTEYLTSLKKTGNIPLDLLVQAFENNKHLDELEGSADLFSTDSNLGSNKLNDSYEDISKLLATKLENHLDSIIDFLSNYDISQERGTLLEFITDIIKENNYGTDTSLSESLNFIVQLHATGMLSTDNLDIINDLLLQKVKDIDNPEIKATVKRNLSKAGVTPTVYGGQLTGITNQLMSNFSDTIKEKANSIIELSRQLDEATSVKDTNKIDEIQKEINSIYKELNLISNSLNDFKGSLLSKPKLKSDMSISYEEFFTKEMDKFLYTLRRNKQQSIDSVKKGLGKQLHESVQETFVESFALLNYAMSHDEIGFSNFIEEFKEKLEVARLERNKKKNYSANDPRQYDDLSRKEIEDVVKTITSAPVIATAFSENAELFEDVLEKGNALIKTGSKGKVGQTTITSPIGLSKGNWVSYISSQLFSKYKEFRAAGASSATGSIPSTESATQVGLAEELSETLSGVTSLDVFDGIDGLLFFRDLLGKIANKQTNRVHLETNLIKSFFDRFSKTGIDKLITQFSQRKSAFGKNLESVKPEQLTLSDLITTTGSGKNSKSVIKVTDTDEVKYLLTVTTLAHMYLETLKLKPSFKNNPQTQEYVYSSIKLLNGLKLQLAQVRDNLLDTENTSEQEIELSKSQVAKLQNIKNILNVHPINIANSYNYMVEDFATKVVEAAALKEIEKKFLPSIINQFGGANRGYFFNEDKLDTTGKMFKEFLNQKGIDIATYDFKNSSDLLAEFLTTNKEIQKEYDKIKNHTYKNLHKPILNSNRDKVADKISITNNNSEDLEKFISSSARGNLIKLLFNTAKSIYGDNFIISSDIEEIADYFQITEPEARKNFIEHHNRFISKGEFGGYKSEVNLLPYIWLNDKYSTTFNIGSSVLVHELQHMAMDALYSFDVNRDMFKQQVEMGILDKKDFNKISLINKRLNNLLESIVDNAKNFSKVQQRLEELNRNPSMFDFYDYGTTSYTPLEISVSNYLFMKQYSLDNLPEGWNEDAYKAIMAQVKNEFVSYAIEDDSMLNELANRREDKRIIDRIRNFFKQIKEEVLKFLGYDTLPESQLTALYEVIEAFRQFGQHNPDVIDNMSFFAEENRKNSSRHIDSRLTVNLGIPSNNSEQHETKLHKFIDIFNTNISNIKDIKSYPEELKLVQQSLTDSKADNILKELRNLNVNVSNLEEEAFKLALASNLANFTSGNKDLQQQATTYLQELIKQTDLNQVNSDLFNLVLNNKSLDKIAVAVALLTTNEQLSNTFKLNKSKQSKLDKKLNDLVELSNSLSIFKDVPTEFKQDTKLNQIQIASMLFNFRSKPSLQAKHEINEQELNKLRLLKDLQDKHKEIYENLPKGIKHLFGLSADLLTGQDLLSDGSGADSSIGSLIRRILENHNRIHGRDTLLAQMAKWVIGQDFNRQYSAKFKGEVDQTSQAIRERISAVIPLSLRNQFENLDQRDEEALDNVLNSSELNRIASISITGMKVSDIVKNNKTRSQAVLDTIQNIKDDLSNYYGPKQVEQITNYLVWQSKGLGQQMVTGEVRTKSNKDNGQILPNAKVIASLRHIPKIAKATTEEVNVKLLEEYVGQLSSLYSLNYQNQDDLDVIADLFDNEPKGMEALVKSLDQLNQELNIQREGNYLGQDGFIYNKKNPNQEVRLVEPNDLEQQRSLSKLGYKHKADLVTSEQVWVTNDSMVSRFTTGVFGLADTSVKGINQQSGKPIKGVYGKTTYSSNIYFDNHPALNDHNYYDKLGSINSSNTQINAQGDIIGSYNGLPKSLEKQFIQSFESGIDAIGNMKGRLMEEIATEQNNQHYINELNKIYNRSPNKHAFTKLDGNYKPKTNKPYDIEFANRLNNIYNSLPMATKEQIARQGGLYIETQEINNILGYSQGSITDLWTGKSGIDPRLQNVIKSTFGLVGQLMGLEGNQVAKRFERGLGEVVSLGKDFVLNRSIVVPAWNIFSNIIHLWNRGIPYNKITPLIKEGTQHILKYNKDMNRLTELYHLKDISTGKDSLKYEAEINILRKALNNNPVKPLVDEGILTSITLDNQSNEDKEFNYIPQLQRKFKFDKFKETKVGKLWGNVAIQEGSWTHDTMQQVLDLGDFVAKYAMYQHLTKDRGFNSDRAMNVIRDEFINYSYNRGRVFDYLNKTGLTWFLSYKLGIQKIILRSLRRNFFRTSAIYGGAKVTGIDNVVPMQNLIFDGSLQYQTDVSNIFSAFGLHWFNMLKP